MTETSRNTINTIQFELWPDCDNGCQFCYLNGTRRITTAAEKKANILDANAILNDEAVMSKYNGVGFIGGEFFGGQLLSSGLRAVWKDTLLFTIRQLLESKKIEEFWLASALLDQYEEDKPSNPLGDAFDTLGYLNSINLAANQRIILCTSYDTIGRFVYNQKFASESEFLAMSEKEQTAFLTRFGYKTFDEVKEAIAKQREENWRKAVKYIRDAYTNITVHVQVILTQDTINKLIENPDYFDFITDMGCLVDFRYPSITRADCPSATVIEDYRTLLLNKYRAFPEHFFIEDRASFLKFLNVFYTKYGITKVENLLHQPEMRSRRLKIYVDDVDIEDRWNDERDRYLDCGHLIDGLCYINDDTHCIYCDIEKFLNAKKEA